LLEPKLPQMLETVVQDTNFLPKLEEYMNKVKPEAAYFMPIDGHRAGAFIVNVESNE
jgi:hypothetical protein